MVELSFDSRLPDNGYNSELENASNEGEILNTPIEERMDLAGGMWKIKNIKYSHFPDICRALSGCNYFIITQPS